MIYMFCPDFSAKSGGTKRVYHVTNILRKNGFDACVMHTKRPFYLTWTGIQVPVTYFNDMKTNPFKEKDLLVIPEGCVNLLESGKLKEANCKKVVFAMSIEYIMSRVKLSQNWSDLGITGAIATTEGLCDFIKQVFGLPAFNIDFTIDFESFTHRASNKYDTIVYAGRPESNQVEANAIYKVLRLTDQRFKKWNIVPLRNYSLKDYAEMMRRAKYYLTLAPRWGCNSPVMEAQACGALIVGYCGVGNTVMHGYTLSQYANIIVVAKKIVTFERDIQQKNHWIDKGLKNARRYTAENEERKIIKTFGGLCEN